jgi:ATP-dependent Lon protease
MRDYRDAKAMAQTLRQALKERSVSLTHSESLELISKVLGFADWNVLSARIQAAPSPTGGMPGQVPALRMPAMPLRDLVLFPQMTTPIYAARVKSVEAIERAMNGDKQVFFVTQLRVADDDPKSADLHQLGVIGSLLQVLKMPDGSIKLMVQGLRRARATQFDADGSCLIAELLPVQEEGAAEAEVAELVREVLQRFEAYANVTLSSPPQALIYLSGLREPGRVADAIAQHLSVSIEQRQELLQTVNVVLRLRRILALLDAKRKAA